jgi:Holliday junction resolvase RusA-like endonuclease
MKFVFSIPVLARSKKNSRPIYTNKKTGRPFLGKSDNLTDYEQTCAILLNIQKNKLGIRKPLEGPLRVDYLFEFKGEAKVDFDNAITGITDVLQAPGPKDKFKVGIIQNDKQIKKGSFEIRENTGLIDRITIEIEIMELNNAAAPG